MTLLHKVFLPFLLLSAAPLLAAQDPPSRPLTLDIAPQPLQDALSELAHAAKLQLIFYSKVGKDVMAPRISGNLTPRVAFDQMLAGTGLRYEFLDGQTVAILGPDSKATTDFSTLQAVDNPLRLAAIEPPQTTAGAESAAAEKEQTGEMVVTGSNIRGIHNKTAPVMRYTSEDFDRSGITTTQDFFRALPQNFSGGESGGTEDGGFGFGVERTLNFSSASGINLRGLGDSSTLVLVNGHRLAPSNIGTVVDVSLLPMSAVDRIDVLTDGSSAIYGADAVAGIVNFVLKDDYSGSQTRMRYGSVTSGGRREELVAHTTGGNWDGGNAIVSLQYQHFSPLDASDREFSKGLTTPNELLPDTHSLGAALHARQSLTVATEIFGDLLYSRKTITRETTARRPGNIVRTISDDGGSDSLNAVAGTRFTPIDKWRIELDAEYSATNIDRLSLLRTGNAMIENQVDGVSKYKTLNALVSGKMRGLPAGDIGVALGSSFRTEYTDLLSHSRNASGDTPGATYIDRRVKAVFGELYAPLVGSRPWMHAVELSAAVRYDDYSDFGSATTPRLGILWAPTEALSFRAAYSKSFRAPNANEVSTAAEEYIFTTPMTDPEGGDDLPVIVLEGGGVALTSERARSLTFGVDYAAPFAPGLTIGLGYYKVRYDNKIVFPPFDTAALLKPDEYGVLITPLADDAAAQAIYDAALARGALDFGTDVAGVRYLFDQRQRNAARVDQSGVDLTGSYTQSFAAGTLSARANISLIHNIDTSLAAGVTPLDLVDTVGNPVSPRVRLDGTWATGRWSASGALNYVGSYVDNFTAPTQGVDSWTTVDLSFSLKLGGRTNGATDGGASLLFSVQNVLDEAPPFVRSRALTANNRSVTYDVANASPLGRFAALELRYGWR